ncbi:MAG TPA: 6,7-dimethyl-8-ribityllumazine synthase [Opitutaceae bacterium]|nr:6,7-dimethyl-8-ribityllumazine synthase [Opitutaceae bacterium]
MSLDAPRSPAIDGSPFRFGIVAARFNAELVDALLETVRCDLEAAGVEAGRIEIVRVPGSHEVPLAAQWLARGRDAIVALGVLIKGDTGHHTLVGEAVAHGLQRVALDTGVPVINGVIVVENRRQAEERCQGPINRGAEFARAALEMAAVRRALEGRR